jgi:histidine triad (HIT) family protein
VHVVVIPKRHVESLLALQPEDDALLADVLAVVREVAAAIVAEHGACRIVTNLGAYQESKHLHWHVGAGDPLR